MNFPTTELRNVTEKVINFKQKKYCNFISFDEKPNPGENENFLRHLKRVYCPSLDVSIHK